MDAFGNSTTPLEAYRLMTTVGMDILRGFNSLPDDTNVFDTVLRLYLRIQRDEEDNKDIRWWRVVYRLGKAAKKGIKDKTDEVDLNEHDRNVNLQIMDAFLFHCWLNILNIQLINLCAEPQPCSSPYNF